MNEQTMHGGIYAQRGFIFQRKVVISIILAHLWCLREFSVEPKNDESTDFEISLSEKHSYYGENLECLRLIAQIKSGRALQRSSSDINSRLDKTLKAFLSRFNSVHDKNYFSFGILTESLKDSPFVGLLKTDLDLIRRNARSSTIYRERGKVEAIKSINKLFGGGYSENFLRRVFVDDGFSFEAGFGIDNLLKGIRFVIFESAELLKPDQLVDGSDFSLTDVASRIERLIEQAILEAKPVTRFMIDSELVKSFKNCYTDEVVAKFGKIEKEVPWWGKSLTVEAPGPDAKKIDLETRTQTISAGARIMK